MKSSLSIASLQKNSFVDYPSLISSVVFFQGCNYNCYFCHNRELIDFTGKRQPVQPADVILYLSKRKNLIDGVVLSGGEPTLQPVDLLVDFMETIKGMGFKIKLDTNGSRPDVIEMLVNKNLADYIAMDIKAPYEKYESVSGCGPTVENVKKSAAFIIDSAPMYEFRTTYVPELDMEDVVMIAKSIKGAKMYVLQQFRKPPVTDTDDVIDYRNLKKPHSPDYFLLTAEAAGPYVEKIITRGI